MKKININSSVIGEDYPCFIVAEAGINHNGDLDIAKRMIRAAKECGADAIKFQTFKAEEFVGDPTLKYTYKSQGREVTESMLEMFKRCEFQRDDWTLIKKSCDEEDIMFLSTPQNLSDLELLLELGISAIKVGSDDFTNIPLLKSYAKTGLPMIVSAGMADSSEIHQVLEEIGATKGYPAVLMLCTSQYPTPPEDVNLFRLATLANTFPAVVLGYSDHTQGVLASSLAVMLGASVLEKHFTLNHDLAGPDHWFSEDPEGLKEWVSSIRKAYIMKGSAVLRPTAQELLNKKNFQRVIVAAKDIRKGQVFSMDNLVMRRMGGKKGLTPGRLYSLLDRETKRTYKKGEIID
ncbi:N-acetylneuraminate synthase family protein [Candidatus Omnitrophota bacterium]